VSSYTPIRSKIRRALRNQLRSGERAAGFSKVREKEVTPEFIFGNELRSVGATNERAGISYARRALHKVALRVAGTGPQGISTGL